MATVMNGSTPRRSASSETLSYLWERLPDEHDSLRAYVDRAKSYRKDCGCAMGAIFVIATLAILVFYGFVFHGFSIQHWLTDALWAAGSLLGSAMLGKLAGIGLARIRLVLLVREVRNRYPVG